MYKKISTLAVVSLLITAIAIVSINIKIFDTVENHLIDLRIKELSSPASHDKNIKIILIDQSSLDWVYENFSLSWPWPRELYAEVLSFLEKSKINIVDIIFSEPSTYGEFDDIKFADELSKKPTIGTIIISDTQGKYSHFPPQIDSSEYIKNSDNKKSYATFATESLISSFTHFGSVSATPDSDGKIRKIELFESFDGKSIPTLSLATQNSYEIIDDKLIIDDKTFNKTSIINYHGASQTYETFNIAQIIESQLSQTESISPDIFKDSYVFIGVSAPGLMDLKSTPTDAIYPGVEIHATVLDNILNSDFLDNYSLYKSAIFIYFITFTTLLAYRFYSNIYYSLSHTIFAMTTAIIFSIYLYYQNELLHLTVVFIAIIIASIWGFVSNYLHQISQKRFIKNAFGYYLSPQVINELVKDEESLKLGGKRETLTILFSDIEGFSSISTKLEPDQLSKLLNEYLEILGDTILKYGGTIDKYIGDAVVAFWNAPLSQSNHAMLAVTSALEAQEILKSKNEYFSKKFGCEINTRYGIHTGEVIVGNMGTSKRFNYTFIGDNGNIAARLESANKQFGTYIMVSEDTLSQIDNPPPSKIVANIVVKGRDSAIKVFEPLDRLPTYIDDYTKAYNLFYSGDLKGAKEIFQSLSSIDVTSGKYLEIIDKLESKALMLQDGVLYLDEK